MEYVKIDKDTLQKVEETITTVSVKDLTEEKKRVQTFLQTREPNDEELMRFARYAHPYYRDTQAATARLKEINDLLKL
jgi:hypothetical protein